MSLVDADGDTGITPEFTADEDVLRYYCAGAFMFAMGSWGMGMGVDTPVIFDGATDGDTKIQYVSATSYLTFETDGAVRIEC